MKNKKIYLRDIKDNDELLKVIFENNERLRDVCGRELYERNMEAQLDYGCLCMGNNYNNYIEIKDYYSSFYLRLRDAEQFINNIDVNYLTTEEVNIYKKAIRSLEKRNNADFYSEKYNEYENDLEFYAKDLLELIEKDLHKYEDISEEDIFTYGFVEELREFDGWDNLYYYSDDVNFRLYEDITTSWN